MYLGEEHLFILKAASILVWGRVYTCGPLLTVIGQCVDSFFIAGCSKWTNKNSVKNHHIAYLDLTTQKFLLYQKFELENGRKNHRDTLQLLLTDDKSNNKQAIYLVVGNSRVIFPACSTYRPFYSLFVISAVLCFL